MSEIRTGTIIESQSQKWIVLSPNYKPTIDDYVLHRSGIYIIYKAIYTEVGLYEYFVDVLLATSANKMMFFNTDAILNRAVFPIKEYREYSNEATSLLLID